MKLVSVEIPQTSVCKMTFSATAEELETAAQAVYERTRQNYAIKGFAKGEADRTQIEADRGEHTFWYDAINDLMDKDVPALYEQALRDNGYEAVNEPTYDLLSVKKDEGFVATALVALRPQLTIAQTEGFAVDCIIPATSDKEVEQMVERRRQAMAELVPHKGPAVKGNIVHLNYAGFLDDKQFPGGTAENQTLELGSGRMIPGFEEGILGHKGGDEFNVTVTFPVQYPSQELAGKEAIFKMKLLDVCVRQIPALNCDFAKKAGKVDTMDEFRAQVRHQIEERKRVSAVNRAKNDIIAKLAEVTEGELPDLLIESNYQAQMQQIQQQLQMQHMTLDRYLKQVRQSAEDFTAAVHADAERNTRIQLALLEIAEKNNLFPTQEELDAQLAQRAERTKKTVEQLKESVDLKQMARNEALRRASDYVIAHSTITEKQL